MHKHTRKQEASDEIDDDVPIGKRNKSKETKPPRELDDDAPILKKKRPSESSGSLIKSSETNGDALKVFHTPTRCNTYCNTATYYNTH